MTFKLAKKYSLILTFVMAFSFFASIIVSAEDNKSDINFQENICSEDSNSKMCGDSEYDSVWIDQWGFLNKETDTLVNSSDDEDAIDDEDTTDDEYDNKYSKDAKNLDNNKKISNENINKMNINKDLNGCRHKEDKSNVYDEGNFSKEDIDIEKNVVEFILILGDDIDIYDQQIEKKGDVAEQIADSERNGYKFDGWYYDKDYSGKSYNFNYSIFRDFKVYAKWIKKEQIFKMKLPRNLRPSTKNNNITNLFQKNRNVSSPPVKPRNSIARFRRLENLKPKNTNNISRSLSENICVFNNCKYKENIKSKNERSFSNNSCLYNPNTGNIGIIVWIGFMLVSVLGTSNVVKLLKKEK